MPEKKARKSKKQILLISNPVSGESKDPTARLEEATRLLMDQGFKVKVALAKPKGIATKLAKKAVRSGYRTVVAMGGDGTIEAVARALVGTKTRLGILPAGTQNNIVTSLGIPEDLEGACRVLADGEPRKIDVGQIKTKKGRKLYFLEVAAVGLIAALFPEANKISKGEWNVIGDVIKELVNFPLTHMVVTLDGESHIEVDSMLATVSNTPSFGVKFLLAPEALIDDGLLDINLYSNISKPRILADFAAISNEGRAEDTKIQRYRARKLTIETQPKQVAMADGIMLGKGVVKIKVKKNALRVITPRLVETPPEDVLESTPEAEPKPNGEAKEQAEKLPAPVAPAPQTERDFPKSNKF